MRDYRLGGPDATLVLGVENAPTAVRHGRQYSSSVSFGAGAYVSDTNASGGVTATTAAITSGACNRCHTSGSRLIVN